MQPNGTKPGIKTTEAWLATAAALAISAAVTTADLSMAQAIACVALAVTVGLYALSRAKTKEGAQ